MESGEMELKKRANQKKQANQNEKTDNHSVREGDRNIPVHFRQRVI